MKVYFINPPFLRRFSRPQRSPAVTKSDTMYYPLMLAQGASNLKYLKNMEVCLIDAPACNMTTEDVFDKIPNSPENIAVIETSTPSICSDIEFSVRLKKERGIKTILVGTHISALKEEILKDRSADGLLVGEWDRSLMDLMDKGEEHTGGYIYTKDNKIIDNGTPPLFEDLDKLPFVSRIYKEFLDIKNYFNPNARYPMVTISTSRGCPYTCRFCLYPQTFYMKRVRRRSIENTLSEIDYIIKVLKPASIFFEDDCFTFDKDYVHNFCTEILRRHKKPFSWTANARADLDYELLSLMRRAGLNVLCVGYESGNQKVLDWMDKKLTKERMLKFSRDAKRAKVLVHGCFIIGAPFEDSISIEQTMDFILKLNPDTIQVYPVIVYPGTEIYKEFEKLNLLEFKSYRDWLTKEGLLNTTVKTEHLSGEDLIDHTYNMRRKFYLRPAYILKKGVRTLTHPSELRRTIKAFIAFSRFLKK